LLRRPPQAPPTGKPLAYLVLAGAAAQTFLVFAVNTGFGTIAGTCGGLAAVLGLVPPAGLCVAATLTEKLDRLQAGFIVAATAAYFGPELYFYLGSLLVSSDFAYLGTAVFSSRGVAVWFLLAQIAATLATAVPAVMIVRRVAGPTST
jgi:hypothetical protein